MIEDMDSVLSSQRERELDYVSNDLVGAFL
jgi:hypothetical protein